LILVVSHEQDPHADRVIQHLRRDGQEVFLLNLSELPNRAMLTIDYCCRERPRIDFTRLNGERFDLNEVRSVWWRRPQVPSLASVTDPQVNLFTANEWNEAINGLWQLLDARWMNDPNRDDAASRKARQLRVAAEVGLKTPRTLITSDPSRARAFIQREGVQNTVYKTFSCTHAVWRETRLLNTEDLEQLDAVQVAPVIFQEFIPAESDLRITHVDGRFYTAAIRSAPQQGLVDFRMSVGDAGMTEEELPDDVAEKLCALMQRLGLVYGAIDMRRSPAGEYFFFEVNTAGEFLFVEDRTSLPISNAIAAWLAEAAIPA
jgi:glutathione synthase/RimK-type ligase-like ATP-grasp enzyme